MLWLRASIAACLMISVSSFGGSEDRFIKKYAMMKIYESCFGAEVVKQIRKEMKLACMKCTSYEPTPAPPQQSTIPSRTHTTAPPKFEGGIAEPENTLYANAQAQPQPFDADKLNHAILAYRPNAFPAPTYRPYAAPGLYSGFPNQGSMFFPAPYQQPSPFGVPPYNLPFFGQPFYNGQRTARDMDIKSQLEALTAKMSGRVKNITCVMQELGYLDENLEPNYSKIRDRIGSLPVSEELRNDIQEGVTFCQKFSQCVPDTNKDKSPLSRELIRPMFFFKCYKHKKLEACIMKDVREKYNGVSDDFDGAEMELRRTGKSSKIKDDYADALASSTYDFLYGSDSNMDLDSVL